MPLSEGPHLDLLREALAVEADGQRALLRGDAGAAAGALREAARLYRNSWEAAPPGAFGRLIGMLKAAVIAGDAADAAAYARSQVPEEAASPPAAYARAIAALVEGDDAAARAAAEAMRAGSDAFARTADAVVALAGGDAAAYAAAVRAIVTDFEARHDHLTGVPIADTALMLERLAQPRGLAAAPRSSLLPTS
ncbi:MAG TPA: hypothetical protein VM266_01705 [Solirubrobacteraceae bacterium]|nr:hypothetical protein [Solirubrobacteraceae bacterium]